jgi:hypothetical protein
LVYASIASQIGYWRFKLKYDIIANKIVMTAITVTSRILLWVENLGVYFFTYAARRYNPINEIVEYP